VSGGRRSIIRLGLAAPPGTSISHLSRIKVASEGGGTQISSRGLLTERTDGNGKRKRDEGGESRALAIKAADVERGRAIF